MKTKINKIGVTNDKISSRGGLPLFLRYIENIGIYELISNTILSKLVFGSKGLRLVSFLKQMFAFFMDGTDMSLTSFNDKKTDIGYTSSLELTTDEMASSHQVKRMIAKLSIIPNWLFSSILHYLFLWRLAIEAPDVIILGVDTMVMDNDESEKKEGCEPTYKKKKGFQPLHISWGPYLIDVLFRKGSAHSNHGTDYVDRVTAVVKFIRKKYSIDIPIIICADSGFADQKAYDHFDSLNIHFTTTSRIYKDTKEHIAQIDDQQYGRITKGKQVWNFLDFGSRRASWSSFRRSIFTTLSCNKDGQYVINDGNKLINNLIITNIGTNKVADERLCKAGYESYLEAKNIVKLSHNRGADELIHRSIKELATKEQLPFKNLNNNKVYYFLLVITHFLFEAYKRDITADVIPIVSYPDTFRRKLIDFAAKITSSAGYVILNVPRIIYETFKIEDLWRKCLSPTKIKFG